MIHGVEGAENDVAINMPIWSDSSKGDSLPSREGLYLARKVEIVTTEQIIHSQDTMLSSLSNMPDHSL